MLYKFRVKNFKNFEDTLEWNLTSGKYTFNQQAVKNDIVKNSIIYGNNGTGKSNLTYAIMDITTHLTDFKRQEQHYTPYKNLNSRTEFAEFYYEFIFDKHKVTYSYKKESMSKVFDEVISIDDKEIIFENFIKNERFVLLKGAETLNVSERDISLSFVKYIFANTNLDSTDIENKIFIQFRHFVEGMLYFGSGTAEGNFYQGLKSSKERITSVIVNSGKIEELQKFLQDLDINYILEPGEDSEGNSVINVRFKNRSVNFYSVASHGTLVILVFFYWLLQLSKIKFLVVDEFDAFYHNEVSEAMLSIIRDSEVQSVFTSHNTSIMSNDLLRPDCYFVLQNNTIKDISSLTRKELRRAHNLEKMSNAGSFNE